MDPDNTQIFQARRESEAIANARDRIDLLAQTCGTGHPDYATALNQLALLHIMQGDPESAEPLLRQSLEIRRASLGETHPDYATNLSSLGGLLWARGDLDQAEPLLCQSVEIRAAVLGPAHPKTIVSRNSLDQLRKARSAAVADAALLATFPGLEPVQTPGPSVPPEPIVRLSPAIRPEHLVKPGGVLPTVRSDVGTGIPATHMPAAAPPFTQSSSRPSPAQGAAAAARVPALVPELPATRAGGEISASLAVGLDEASALFATLASRFNAVGRALLAGRAPEDAVITTARAAAARFDRLRLDVVTHALALGIDCPGEGPADLESVAALLPRLAAAEDERREARALRAAALALLDRSDRLACPADSGLPALAICRELTESLRGSILAAREDVVTVEARRLATGDHPLCALLSLVAADEATDDSDWAEWYEAVEVGLGHPLAVAAARARLVERVG